MRVIVTGSRDWPWDFPVQIELDRLLEESDAAQEPFYLRVGDCPTGPDRAARTWWAWMHAQGNRVAPDSLKIFEADWGKYPRAAGPIRNKEMVDAGADVCLAFRLNVSRGTSDCMFKACEANIPVKLFDLEIHEPNTLCFCEDA